MAIKQDITAEEKWFAGEDKTFEFEILDEAQVLPVDVATWALAWVLREQAADAVPSLSKVNGAGGITVTGVYNVDRLTNTQRVIVAVAAGDTRALVKRNYKHALKRTDPGLEMVLANGDFVLLVPAAR